MANNFFDTLTSRINLQKKCRVVIPNGASKAVVFAITEAIRNNFISLFKISFLYFSDESRNVDSNGATFDTSGLLTA